MRRQAGEMCAGQCGQTWAEPASPSQGRSCQPLSLRGHGGYLWGFWGSMEAPSTVPLVLGPGCHTPPQPHLPGHCFLTGSAFLFLCFPPWPGPSYPQPQSRGDFQETVIVKTQTTPNQLPLTTRGAMPVMQWAGPPRCEALSAWP